MRPKGSAMIRATKPLRATLLGRPAVLGVLYALGAVVAWGSAQVLIRRLVTGAVAPAVGATLALFFGMIYLFFISRPRLSADLKAPRRSLVFALLAGLTAAIGVYANYLALSLAPVVVVAPIITINPLVTLILAAIFLRQLERITLRLVLGALLVIGGVVLVIVGGVL